MRLQKNLFWNGFRIPDIKINKRVLKAKFDFITVSLHNMWHNISKSTIISESVMAQSLRRMLGSRYFWDNPQNSLLSRWCGTTKFSFNWIFFEVRHLSLAPGRQHDVEIFGSHVTTDDTPASSKSIQIFDPLFVPGFFEMTMTSLSPEKRGCR